MPEPARLERAGQRAPGGEARVDPPAAAGGAPRPRELAPRPAGLSGAVKRAGDLLISIVLLAALAPLFAIIAIAIRLESPGPVLFRQRRSGRGAREFVILKFRTMKIGTPHLASHLVGPGSGHVTRVGGVLRRLSIDELPQLWNVIRGEMALVGPRPALFNQHDLIALRQAAGVDALRPGVTGWAQVNGRDDISLGEKVRLDRYYLEHAGWRLDLRILLRTTATLFSSRGVF